MKKLLFFMLIAIFTINMQAQNYDSYQLIDSDTLTNADTIIGTYPLVISQDYYYSVQVVCDSLTGNPNGTAYLQQSNDDGSTPEKWTNVSGKTLTLNGTGTYSTIWEGGTTPFLGVKLRVYILGAGTATVDCNAWLVIKRKH